MKPQLVDHSQLNIGKKVYKRVYNKTERISIFLNGILIMIIITGILVLYYRYLMKEKNNKKIEDKIKEINNIIYN
tara:strand:- start:1397 stop:1621 length:225 start_codon:yes stop_codon:yes gene_type:complete